MSVWKGTRTTMILYRKIWKNVIVIVVPWQANIDRFNTGESQGKYAVIYYLISYCNTSCVDHMGGAITVQTNE